MRAQRMALAVVLIGSFATAQQPMNGTPTKRYEGSVVSFNEGNGQVVIRTSSAAATWKVGPETVVYLGTDRIDRGALAASDGVIAFVWPNGFVHQVDIRAIRPDFLERPDVGEVISLNEQQGQIVVRMPASTGTWRVDAATVVSFDRRRVPVREVLRSRKVRVVVAQSGHLDVLQILLTH